MKKLALTLTIVIAALSLNAQKIGIGAGYMSTGHASAEINIFNNDLYYNLDFSTNIPRGLEGEKIGTNNYAKTGDGQYSFVGYFGIGFKVWNEFYFIPKMGAGYVYNYDTYKSGEFYKLYEPEWDVSFGGEVEYFLTSSINLGIEYNTLTGAGLSVAYFF